MYIVIDRSEEGKYDDDPSKQNRLTATFVHQTRNAHTSGVRLGRARVEEKTTWVARRQCSRRVWPVVRLEEDD